MCYTVHPMIRRTPDLLTVRDLPPLQRPRERLLQRGAEALSEPELLACVLGRGVVGESVLSSAHRLLATFGSLQGIAAASVEQLTQLPGIGRAKAIQLKAAVELARRLGQPTAAEPPLIDTAEQAAAIVRPHLLEKPQEHVVALLLDVRHRLIRLHPVAVGSLSASLVHPREVFRPAIAAGAAAMLLAHNHPSGDPEPSAADVELTRRLQDAGELVGIPVVDHLIIATGGVVSLRAEGVFTTSRGERRARRSAT